MAESRHAISAASSPTNTAFFNILKPSRLLRRLFACDPDRRIVLSNATHVEHQTVNRYQVSVQQYIAFRRDGFLVVPQLVSKDDVAELCQHTDDLMQGRLPEQQRRM